MGGAISSPPQVESVRNLKDVQLKQLPDAIEEAIFIHEKFPLIIDPTEQAARLFRFRYGPKSEINVVFEPFKGS